MMKQIMKVGAVSVALAAAALLTQTASAAPDSKPGVRSYTPNRSDYVGQTVNPEMQRGSRGNVRTYEEPNRGNSFSGRNQHQNGGGNEFNGWKEGHGISHHERRQAIGACAIAVQRKTDRFFPGPYGQARFLRQPDVERGRHGVVKVSAQVKIEGRHRDMITKASCKTRDGRVVDLDYKPGAHRNQNDRGHFWSWNTGWGHR